MSDLISREAAIKDAKSWVAVDEYEKDLKEIVIEWLKEFPSAELSTNLASLGTDAISRNALINKLEQWQKQDGYNNGEWNLLVDVINEIKNMPLATDIYVGTNDAISRQAAIDAINEYMVGKRCDTDGTMMARLINELVIKQLPSIQPKRGKWILVTDNNGQHFECNCCGEWRYHQEQKFCGECGAKMEVST